jgi:2,5-diamino-6-(ribosylamino)-4(3H)-pyrimidinone 5'-phosphate reductase
MLPYTILHNSVSLDGSLTDFDVNMELHYKIAGSYKSDVHLIGSNTIKKGIELYSNGVPSEEENDFEKPTRDKSLPLWVIIDTKGSLKGLLHTVRRFDFCRDIIILLSERTPKDYINYLEKRCYDYHVCGKDHIDLEKSFELLSNVYLAKTVLTDTGRILGNLLLNKGLVNEISLLIHPVFVGDKSYDIFDDVSSDIKLELLKNETIEDNYIWLVYGIKHH